MAENFWNGRTAIVTGAGSGIGRALSLALTRRGVRVVATDIDERASRRVASECGAVSRHLDVRDAESFQAVVDETAAHAGSLDFLFNNAGIGAGGETETVALSVWNRIIDINLRGVVHGVAAAYPLMVRQGFGHIVNTASIAGLTPWPLLTPYVATKFAVVGLSTSLRLEAKKHGVHISALCPGVIETPLLDSEGPDDLPKANRILNVRRYLTRAAGKTYPAERLAEDALRGVERNVGVILAPPSARFLWILSRLLPGLLEATIARNLQAERLAP